MLFIFIYAVSVLLWVSVNDDGAVQLVVGHTQHFPGQILTGLDHFYTNIPGKISSIQSFQQYVRKHSYKKL